MVFSVSRPTTVSGGGASAPVSLDGSGRNTALSKRKCASSTSMRMAFLSFLCTVTAAGCEATAAAPCGGTVSAYLNAPSLKAPPLGGLSGSLPEPSAFTEPVTSCGVVPLPSPMSWSQAREAVIPCAQFLMVQLSLNPALAGCGLCASVVSAGRGADACWPVGCVPALPPAAVPAVAPVVAPPAPPFAPAAAPPAPPFAPAPAAPPFGETSFVGTVPPCPPPAAPAFEPVAPAAAALPAALPAAAAAVRAATARAAAARATAAARASPSGGAPLAGGFASRARSSAGGNGASGSSQSSRRSPTAAARIDV